MFIREYITVNNKTKTEYIVHRLVEAYRDSDGKTKQRIILHLGKLELPRNEWKKLAASLEARLAGQISIFEEKKEIAEAVDQAMEHYTFINNQKDEKAKRTENVEFVSVNLESITTTDSRSLGPEIVCHETWNKLNFISILKSCGMSEKQISIAEAIVINRMIEPSSDLASFGWLKNRTALLELLPYDLKDIGKDSIYEIGDILLKTKSV